MLEGYQVMGVSNSWWQSIPCCDCEWEEAVLVVGSLGWDLSEHHGSWAFVHLDSSDSHCRWSNISEALLVLSVCCISSRSPLDHLQLVDLVFLVRVPECGAYNGAVCSTLHCWLLNCVAESPGCCFVFFTILSMCSFFSHDTKLIFFSFWSSVLWLSKCPKPIHT